MLLKFKEPSHKYFEINKKDIQSITRGWFSLNIKTIQLHFFKIIFDTDDAAIRAFSVIQKSLRAQVTIFYCSQIKIGKKADYVVKI